MIALAIWLGVMTIAVVGLVLLVNYAFKSNDKWGMSVDNDLKGHNEEIYDLFRELRAERENIKHNAENIESLLLRISSYEKNINELWTELVRCGSIGPRPEPSPLRVSLAKLFTYEVSTDCKSTDNVHVLIATTPKYPNVTVTIRCPTDYKTYADAHVSIVAPFFHHEGRITIASAMPYQEIVERAVTMYATQIENAAPRHAEKYA